MKTITKSPIETTKKKPKAAGAEPLSEGPILQKELGLESLKSLGTTGLASLFEGKNMQMEFRTVKEVHASQEKLESAKVMVVDQKSGQILVEEGFGKSLKAWISLITLKEVRIPSVVELIASEKPSNVLIIRVKAGPRQDPKLIQGMLDVFGIPHETVTIGKDRKVSKDDLMVDDEPYGHIGNGRQGVLKESILQVIADQPDMVLVLGGCPCCADPHVVFNGLKGVSDRVFFASINWGYNDHMIGDGSREIPLKNAFNFTYPEASKKNPA